MPALFALLVFAFGLVIGSFLNVVIFRYNTGKTLGGRSQCFSCNRSLVWYELVPLVSFLVLRGRCRHCKSKLSLQYYLVELLTAVVCTLTVARLFELGYLTTAIFSGSLVLGLHLLVVALLVVIAVYDYRHKIIPDGIVYAFILAALGRVILSFSQMPSLTPWYVDIVSGALLALFFAALWYFSKGRWMGFGDAKLVLGIGWFLPFTQNVAAVLVAFWLGAVVGLVMIAISKLLKRHGHVVSMSSEVPFAPFLILGFFLVFLFGIDLSTLAFYLQF
ncbi:MAG: hypothetical protein A2542_02510 [Parcubacteria group bacterium RIFOXYD2_FULL_52_8]|nr:MAG: hypothetical protein A2542_02510 [Parcubacteria group bacterium RIFOXYD2_FULL_52_8]